MFPQNALFEIPDFSPTNTLIREYKDKNEIIFVKDAQSSFLFVDRSTMLVYEAKLTVPADVTDMEIVGDKLFFCANYLGGLYCGFFDIYATFFGSASINVFQIPFYPQDVVNDSTIYPESVLLSKMEVYYPSGSNIHIFMVADVIFNSSLTTDYSVLMDLRYDGSSWIVDIEEEPDRIYYFNDITLTENYLWVVGHKNGGRGEYMHGYDLNIPPGTSQIIGLYLCAPSLMKYWATDNDFYFPVSKPLIETIGGDTVVVACYGMVDGYWGVVISGYTIGSSVSLLTRGYVSNVTLTSEFRDLKYNPYLKKLYLMPDHNHSVTQDALYLFDMASNCAFIFQSLLPEIHSLDFRKADEGAMISGITKEKSLGEWKLFPAYDNCARITDLLPSINSTPPFGDCNPLHYFWITPNRITVKTKIYKHSISKVCGDPWRTE